ncbi:MAG: FtsQ-type POTRA domain-containing protein, partial [Microbacteriaceae bacterium]|nr:FtsQ-type POTRA domain-containing protein [Microbacteriaceae bacterium]
MQPPKNRFTSNSTPRSKPIKAQVKRTPKKLPPEIKRQVRKEAKRFTGEISFTKYFLRGLAGGLALLIVLVLATMFTPLMAIEKITVTGNKKVSDAQIMASLKHRIGSPLPLLSETDVAKDLEKFRVIESISILSQPPNKVEIRVTERSAIAIVIRGSTRYLYDPAGINLGQVRG